MLRNQAAGRNRWSEIWRAGGAASQAIQHPSGVEVGQPARCAADATGRLPRNRGYGGVGLAARVDQEIEHHGRQHG
jgi:hypothetical protein